MAARRVIGIVLVALGVVSLVWGGVFWTDRDTVFDAGPIQVTTEKREGFKLPQVLGVLSFVGGVILLVVPDRRRT